MENNIELPVIIEKYTREYSCRELFMRDVVKLLIFCHNKGYGVTAGELYRTKEQQKIYKEGWKYVDSKWQRFKDWVRSWVLWSKHQDRLAIDLHIWDAIIGANYILDRQWIEIGEYWCSLRKGNRWGGNFGLKKEDYFKKIGRDRFHFEGKK